MTSNVRENRPFYRKNVKTELSGEDGLDKATKVIPSGGWLLIIGGLLIVAAFLVWAFFGSISTMTATTGFYHPGASEQGEVLCFIPLAAGKVIEEGMKATVYPDGYNQQEYGHMSGSVTYVDDYVTSVDRMKQLLQEDTVVNVLTQSGPVVLVVVRLDRDSTEANSYLWSNPEGGNLDIRDGSFCAVTIVTEEKRPISEFF